MEITRIEKCNDYKYELLLRKEELLKIYRALEGLENKNKLYKEDELLTEMLDSLGRIV